MELTSDQAARTTSSTPPSDISPPGDIPWWSYPANDAVSRMRTDRALGLPDDEALVRIQQTGPNSLPEEEEESVWQSLIEAFQDPLAVVLTIAAGLSAIIGLARGETQELKQAALIMGIVVFMTLVGYFTDRSAGNELAKLKDLQKVFARLIRGGKQIQVEAQDVVPGDIVFLTQGSRVPADARIVEAGNATVDEALCTGEPL